MKKKIFILALFLFVTFSVCLLPYEYIHAEEVVSNKVTLKYNANRGKGAPSSVSVEKDTNIYVSNTTPKRNGYLFLGWSLEKNGDIKYQKEDAIKLENDTVLYAAWGKKIKVSFSANGGKPNKTYTMYQGQNYKKLYTPKKKGYTFLGWYTKKSGGTLVDSNTLITKAKNHKLYAHWSKNTYTITYNLNGGTDPGNKTSYTVTTKTFKLKSPKKTGYTFKGWFKNSNYKGKVTSVSKGSTGNKTYYAKWAVNKYVIEFNGNGASSKKTYKQNIKYDASTALTANKFTKKGYVFEGWSTSKNGSVVYTDKEAVLNLTPKNNKKIVLYAIWSAPYNTVSFNTVGGNTIADEKVYVGKTATKPSDPVKEGYTFVAWTLNGVEYDFSRVVDSNITLVARWQNNDIWAEGFGSYSRDVVGFEGCYLKGTLTEPTSVKVGDIIVCRTGFEVNSTDAISKLRYTLTYGSGLKLVGEEKEDTYVLNKTGNTYEINYKKATPVDTGIITYEFEVISEENLTCDLTGIKFITSDGKKYTSGDENSTFTATWGGNFASYKRNVVGIEGCQIDGTFVDISDEPGVSVGDVIVCRPGFEVDGTDAISKLRYTLTYGSGLELMGYETEDTYVLNKTGNTYEVIYNEATGVDTGSILYQFRVVSETDLTYGLSDIKFITSNGSKYKSENKSYKFTPAWSGYFVTYSRNVVGIEGCQVNGAIVDISDEPGVSVGDVITCRPGFEVNSTDAISLLKYTLTYGSGLELMGYETEDTYELTKTENTYVIKYDDATPVDTGSIIYQFRVVSEANISLGLSDIKFITADRSKYYKSENKNYNFTNIWGGNFTSYKRNAVGFESCYLKGTNTEPTSVEVGDRIICRPGFEVDSTDAISRLKYTLTYGSGLSLVGEEAEDTYELRKTENTYEIVYDEATPVDTAVIAYEFEVVSETNLTYGLTDIKFVTSGGSKYQSGDSNYSF